MGCSSSSVKNDNDRLDQFIVELANWKESAGENEVDSILVLKIKDCCAVTTDVTIDLDTKISRIMMIRDRMKWSRNVINALNILINSLNRQSTHGTERGKQNHNNMIVLSGGDGAVTDDGHTYSAAIDNTPVNGIPIAYAH